MVLYEAIVLWIKEIPNYFKTQEMCNEVVRIEPRPLASPTDRFKTQEMCNKAGPMYPY